MAQSQATRSMKTAAPVRPLTSQERVTRALTQASTQAKKQLIAEGLKLPTQSWTGSAVRNPAV